MCLDIARALCAAAPLLIVFTGDGVARLLGVRRRRGLGAVASASRCEGGRVHFGPWASGRAGLAGIDAA
jgi:hypothetical protein